jgi:hypothetical protein
MASIGIQLWDSILKHIPITKLTKVKHILPVCTDDYIKNYIDSNLLTEFNIISHLYHNSEFKDYILEKFLQISNQIGNEFYDSVTSNNINTDSSYQTLNLEICFKQTNFCGSINVTKLELIFCYSSLNTCYLNFCDSRVSVNFNRDSIVKEINRCFISMLENVLMCDIVSFIRIIKKGFFSYEIIKQLK